MQEAQQAAIDQLAASQQQIATIEAERQREKEMLGMQSTEAGELVAELDRQLA